MEKGDFKSIASFDLELSEKAGECALRSLIILVGALDGFKVNQKSYPMNSPFGVGYCNAKFQIEGRIMIGTSMKN